ncbi:MAG: cytochrome c biogenesis protein CcdA [Candidatus Ornithospirochaeta sp.]
MNFSFFKEITGLMAFLEGVLSFFSPCVLPLLPVYFSFLSGGNVERNEKGELVYKRKTVIINTLFFVLGISLTFFILSLGVKGIGKIFSKHQEIFSLIGGIVIIIFGLWELIFYGTKYGAKKEKRININTGRAKGPLLSFLLGFSFSFSWTPCIGPILSSVLIMASSSLKGELYLLLYALGFTLPFILLGFFTSSLLHFFQKYKGIVKYSVRIGSAIMILIGIVMIASSIPSGKDEAAIDIDEELPLEEILIEESYSYQISSEEENTETTEIISIEEEIIEEVNEITIVEEENNLAFEEEISIEEVASKEESEVNEEVISNDNSIEETAVDEKCDLDSLNFTFLDQYGKIHRLSSYKGKVIFLNAWATWCGPCKSEMPEIEELYNKYKDSEDVVVLSVAFPLQSGEGNSASIKSFMKENGYTYPVLLDTTGKLASNLGISAFPTTFLFDKKGNIYGYIPGAISLEIMEMAIDETLNSI